MFAFKVKALKELYELEIKHTKTFPIFGLKFK